MNKLLLTGLLVLSGCAQQTVTKEPITFMSPLEAFESVKNENAKFDRRLLYKAYLLDGDHLTFEFEKLETPKKYYPDNWKSDKAVNILYYGKFLTAMFFDEHDSKELVDSNIAFLQKEVKGHKVYLPLADNTIRVEHLIIIKE